MLGTLIEERMMKKHAFGGMVLGLALLFGHAWFSNRETGENGEPVQQTVREPANISTPAAAKISAETLITPESEAAESAKRYFRKELLGNRGVSRIYHSVLDRLPPGQDSDLIAVYISESVARNGSGAFSEFMENLHQGLRDRSRQLYSLLTANEAALMQDPFHYQMMLNLAAKLSLPGEMKAELLGGAMKNHFATDPKSGVSPMSRNITNALILMKNNGISYAQAAPYIQRGVEINRDDPNALAEFAARANAYYPGSVR